MKPLHNLRQLGWLLVLWFVVVSLGMLGGFVEFSHRAIDSQETVQATPTPVPQPLLILDPAQTPPQYSAQQVWIYDRTSGSLLYEDNAEEATSVASLAKIMTALVAYESYDLQDELPVASAASVIGNKAKFLPRDRFSVADFLRAMLIFSANDAAQALANGLGGDDHVFIEKMNERAQLLKLNHTHFVNSYGIDNPEQYSSAADVGVLADALLSVPFLEDVVGQDQATLRERRTGRTDVVYSTNVLLRQGPQYRGVKTGTTEQAGESLVVRYLDETEGQPGKLDLLLVILGSENRYSEAKSLIQWTLDSVRPNPDLQTFSQP